MKKYFDRVLFSRFGTQLLASVVIVLIFSAVAPLCRKLMVGANFQGGFQFLGWGLKQVSSPAGAVGTLESLDGVSGAIPRLAMLLVAVCCWIVSIGVFSFITGSIVNWFRSRKQLIDSGLMRYKFKDHGLIIGWDFQGPSCVKELLKDCGEVLVVSAVDAKTIRNELKMSIRSKDFPRVYIYHGLVTAGKSTLVNSWPELSKTIVILGERNGLDNDGGNLHIERIVRSHIQKSCVGIQTKRPPIRVYLHIEDSVLYTQSLAMPREGFSENDDVIDLEVYNYYESWAWRCWSLKDACDGDLDGCGDDHAGEPYLPLRHKPDAERVELFIVGSSLMGQAMTNYAMPLMNYGEDQKHCKITIFDDSENGGVFLPEKWALNAMPEVDVAFMNINGGSDEANDIMIKAASDPKTAVTIVIATPGPDAAVKAYAELANTLRRMDISVLVWQATTTEKCPRKPFLQTCGDCAKLRFFGMTDRLPWKNPAREANGAAVNYFYDVIFNHDAGKGMWRDPSLPQVALPMAEDASFAETAVGAWRPELSKERWASVARWAKWSSVNSGDSFKEKAFSFGACATDPGVRMKLLHAEHNRWWTERLLAGWRPCVKPMDADVIERKKKERSLKASYRHWDLVPFDQLDAFTRDLDKVNVAAMVACGYVKGR